MARGEGDGTARGVMMYCNHNKERYKEFAFYPISFFVMMESVKLTNFEWESQTFQIEVPDVCPVCNKGVSVSVEEWIYSESNDWRPHREARLEVVFRCKHKWCNRYFIAYFKWYVWWVFKVYHLEPTHFHWKDFWENIEELKKISPRFFEIYKESEKAEKWNLKEICWWWYRKALEFLVKDYAIYLNSGNEEVINQVRNPKFTLKDCINTYMPTQSIKTFWTLSAWLWNDEVHYTRQHDKDIPYLKKTIDALLQSISMLLLEKEAEDIINPPVAVAENTTQEDQ